MATLGTIDKVNNMKKFLAVLVAGLCINANASNWMEIAVSSDNNTKIYLDIDSVKPYTKYVSSDGDYVSGFAQHTYINNHELREDGFYYTKFFYIVDCKNSTFYTPSSITYGFKDEVVDSYDRGYVLSNSFKMAFPDTLGESIVTNMCIANLVNQG